MLAGALAVILAACGAPVTTPSPTAQASATPSASPSTEPPQAIAPTRICDGALEARGPSISCTEAIGQALLVLGPETRSIQSAWVRPGAPCPPNARCIAPDSGSAYVVLKLEGARIRFVRIVTVDGEIAIGVPEDPTYDLWPASGRAIPPVGRPNVGPRAPAEVAGRVAFPLCGEERVGAFDRREGRNCFLGAVLDGRPAELVSEEAEGFEAIVVLYRFAGSGPVLVYRSAVAAGGGWVRDDCAIGSSNDEETIFTVSECLSTPLP
jgi:hypothetical protein